MPSRSFGDLYLKDEQFNKPLYSGGRIVAPALGTFTGPYITHSPDIIIQDIKPNDRFIILASDGLWDEMSEQDAAEVVADNLDNPAEALVEQALTNAAQLAGGTLEQIC